MIILVKALTVSKHVKGRALQPKVPAFLKGAEKPSSKEKQ